MVEQYFLAMLRVMIRHAIADAAKAAMCGKRSNGLPTLKINARHPSLALRDELLSRMVEKEERSGQWRRIRTQLNRQQNHAMRRWFRMGWTKQRIAASLNRMFPRHRSWSARSVSNLIFNATTKLMMK